MPRIASEDEEGAEASDVEKRGPLTKDRNFGRLFHAQLQATSVVSKAHLSTSHIEFPQQVAASSIKRALNSPALSWSCSPAGRASAGRPKSGKPRHSRF